jgi:hypothetical protein
MLSFSGLQNKALPHKCDQAIGIVFFFRKNIYPADTKRFFEGTMSHVDALFFVQDY